MKKILQKVDEHIQMARTYLDRGYRKEAIRKLHDAIEIILAESSIDDDKGDEITGVRSNKNNGNTGFAGGCTEPTLV